MTDTLPIDSFLGRFVLSLFFHGIFSRHQYTFPNFDEFPTIIVIASDTCGTNDSMMQRDSQHQPRQCRFSAFSSQLCITVACHRAQFWSKQCSLDRSHALGIVWKTPITELFKHTHFNFSN
uniref:AlNc14C5G694 protein n=1 Tax=Albugo laibachii Nc14 TaxID=890382 RepID=F0W0Q9_9STRA|nr:AlNc14C5G694 [Albugo laibachii Nc14]|eukprot:CCA14633.1 AlNc14C5G694 [Albugo laibachii Nc14]